MEFIAASYHTVKRNLGVLCGDYMWVVIRVTKNRITMVRRRSNGTGNDNTWYWYGNLHPKFKYIQPNGELGARVVWIRRDCVGRDVIHTHPMKQIKKEIQDSKIFNDPFAPYKGFHGLTVDIIRENRSAARTSASKADNDGATPSSPASNDSTK